MKIVYGPIASWRLGRSLGVDLICQEEKICSFDCIYCQLKKTGKITYNSVMFGAVTKVCGLFSLSDAESALREELSKLDEREVESDVKAMYEGYQRLVI